MVPSWWRIMSQGLMVLSGFGSENDLRISCIHCCRSTSVMAGESLMSFKVRTECLPESSSFGHQTRIWHFIDSWSMLCKSTANVKLNSVAWPLFPTSRRKDCVLKGQSCETHEGELFV